MEQYTGKEYPGCAGQSWESLVEIWYLRLLGKEMREKTTVISTVNERSLGRENSVSKGLTCV